MIKIEKQEVLGWEHAIRGMRNPLNSWDRMDSGWGFGTGEVVDEDSEGYLKLTIGKNDKDLMMRLRNAGTDHRKFMRMITVYVDITAPLYWWKEFDTYKVGTVANSCSTMHKLTAKKFTLDDFSHEHLGYASKDTLKHTIAVLNYFRDVYIHGGDINDDKGSWVHVLPENKDTWWQMIQLLPSSYNQERTVMLNYEVLANIYKSRKNHKLDEWVEFCKWIKTLPCSEVITGNKENWEEKIKNATGLDGYSIRIEDNKIIREKDAIWTPEKIASLGIPYPCDMKDFMKAYEKIIEEKGGVSKDLSELVDYLAVRYNPICNRCHKKGQRSVSSEECLKCPFYGYAVFNN